MLDIDFDRERKRLRMRYSGLWTTTEANAAREKIDSTLTLLAKEHSVITLLDDLTEYMPQSAEVAAINADLSNLSDTQFIIRNAMVIPSTILRMQVRRSMGDVTNCRLFENFAEADQWLAEVEGA